MDEGISIVIATRDRAAMLDRCLCELVRHVRPQDEVVVVDSASAVGSLDEIVVRYPVARLLRLERPGSSRARNAGWRAAARAIIAFIDDDCLVSDGWPQAIESALTESDVGFATGRVLGDRPSSLSISLLLDERPHPFDEPRDPSLYGHGSNMAFRRAALEAVAGFDERMGPGAPLRAAEDQDIFWRLCRAGWRGRYDPRIAVTHLQWRSPGRAVARHLAYGVGAGAVAVKMIRTGDPLGWPTLRARVWDDGLRGMARSALRRHKAPAAASLAHFVGAVVGAARAWAIPLEEARFHDRSRLRAR